MLADDGDLVVEAGTPEGWGVGVIACTGSITVGRAPDGREPHAGGWDYLIGDEGSADAVAISTLNAVSRRAVGREPSPKGGDPLADRLCRSSRVETPSRIVSALYAPGLDRTRIAGLAPEVLAAARDDPGSVAPIFRDEGVALAEPVAAVARALGLDRDGLPLAMVGGFLLSAGAVSAAIRGTLADQGFRVVATAVPEPVLGAILLAGRSLADA